MQMFDRMELFDQLAAELDRQGQELERSRARKVVVEEKPHSWKFGALFRYYPTPSIQCPYCGEMFQHTASWLLRYDRGEGSWRIADVAWDQLRIERGFADTWYWVFPHMYMDGHRICMGQADSIDQVMLWGLNPQSPASCLVKEWLARATDHGCKQVADFRESMGERWLVLTPKERMYCPTGFEGRYARTMATGTVEVPPAIEWDEGEDGDDDDDWDDDDTVFCVECDETLAVRVAIENPDGDWMCETCYYDSYQSCARCGEVVNLQRDSVFDVPNGEQWCQDCYSREYDECERCDQVTSVDALSVAPDGSSFCPECYQEQVAECVDCLAEELKTDMFRTDSDEPVCAGCWEKREEEKGA